MLSGETKSRSLKDDVDWTVGSMGKDEVRSEMRLGQEGVSIYQR